MLYININLRCIDAKEIKMLRENKPQKEVGVVVGRFQVNDLHIGHKDLLSYVFKSHQRVIIFLGISPCKCTVNNPLDYEARRAMLQEYYPDATIAYINDVHSDTLWSEELDKQIISLIGPNQEVLLYGSRDSFIPHYHGKFKVKELAQESYLSGSEVRKRLAMLTKNTKDFRAGAIWAMSNQWPGPKFCVDIAIFNDDNTKILLGRKKKEDKYRFIGGFVDNKETLEAAALRETLEETHLEVTNLTYVASFPIDDWRYRGERDKITTALFAAKAPTYSPTPDDDICELRWFPFNSDLVYQVVENHKQLIQKLLE